jgi:ParB family chromosome partitioning protein
MEVILMPDIELKKIQPNRLNPRLEFSKAGLDELADSIKRVGLLEPIVVRPKDGQYEVVVGERRYRAAQQAGLDIVPVIIRDYADDEVMELNLIENIQREDLTVVERARVCKQLRESLPDKYPNWEVIANKIGVSFETIKSWVRTLGLPDEIQQRIAAREPTERRLPKGKIDYQTALHIAEKVKQPEKQVELARRLAEKHMPQRAAREIIREVAKEPEKPIQQVFREVVEEAPIFLPFSKAHADAIEKGIKTQTSRKAKDPRLEPGVTVRAQVTHFADLQVTEVYRKKLGDFDDEDARREGSYTLDEFKEVWKKLHGAWNPNESVYVIGFRLARMVGEPDNSS